MDNNEKQAQETSEEEEVDLLKIVEFRLRQHAAEGNTSDSHQERGEEEVKMAKTNKKDAGQVAPAESRSECKPLNGTKVRTLPTSTPGTPETAPTTPEVAPPNIESTPGAFAEGGRGADETAGHQRQTIDIENQVRTQEVPAQDGVAMAGQTDNNGLAVANPVADTNDPDFPVAQEVGSGQETKPGGYSRASKKKVGFASCALILAGVIVLLILLLQADSKATTPEEDSSEQKAQKRLHELLPSHTLETISNSSSPQALAYEFLLQDPSLEGYPDWRIRQRFALATFFHSTGGAEWRKNASWLDYNTHECDWYARPSYGINYNNIIQIDDVHPCGDSPTGMYKHLWLWNNGLVGSIPEEVSFLSELKSISIYFNNFTGSSIPSSLGLLSSLDGINIGKSGLAGPIPQDVVNMPNLAALVLMDNKLTGTIPSQLGLLSKLSLAVLEHNDLTGSIPTQFGLCKDLIGMWLNGNNLVGRIPSELGLLTNFYYLDLSLNRLTSTIPPELGQLPRITRIILPHNQLTGAIPSALGSLSTMTNLMVQSNYLTGPLPTQIGLMTNLDRLLIFNNTLTGLIPTELGFLVKTTDLDICSNHFLGTIPSQLGLLTSLIELDVSNNQLTGTVPLEMDVLPDHKLRRLHISGNDGLSGVLPESFCTVKEFVFNCTNSLCGCNCGC